ncbi:uncharacterized protein B0P05DRAFT_531758 [Gilbertella persicaria]|uniref:uncharacterized protein n=1 Tax=Gilbertella persicaria TaxID=101096 RepID=UPI00221E5710|nr:uncharacterized protein B0P05DRAFT_531758 [Gilbertella persicaria]KAI8087646.1 hypothetical protein B0P05DRAFT_531758 [Gilbertella persicaria]
MSNRLLSRSCCLYFTKHQYAAYSTLPKEAAGKFTSNKLINTTKSDSVQRTLVYIGPFSETMKRYKMTASFFGLCGIVLVPALINSAPPLSVLLAGLSTVSPAIFVHFYTKGYVSKLIVYDDVKQVEKERKKPRDMKDKFVGIETISFFGKVKLDSMWLSQLNYTSTPKGIVWRNKQKFFTFEREIMHADPYLRALCHRVEKKQS